MRLYSTAAALFISFVSVAAAAQTGSAPGASEDEGYSFRCGEKPSVQDWSAELDKIQPVNPVFGGTLIVSLPPRPTADDGRGACLQAMYEARIEAIRRTEIFDQVKVSYDDTAGARPALPPRTFGVWVEHDGLIAGYADAMRQSTMTAQTLDIWATQTLRQVLKAARAGSNPSSTDIAATGVGPTKYFGYKGREYINYNDLRSAFAANEKDYAGGIHPAQPVGKRLLVVIPPEQSLVARLTEHFRDGDPSGSFGKVAGSSAYFAHLGQADAVRKSGLFHEIAVEEKDLEDVPAGSYDAVLWIKDGAYDWTLSVGGRPAIQFASPAGADPEQMVLAVTDAYAKAQSEQR